MPWVIPGEDYSTLLLITLQNSCRKTAKCAENERSRVRVGSQGGRKGDPKNTNLEVTWVYGRPKMYPTWRSGKTGNHYKKPMGIQVFFEARNTNLALYSSFILHFRVFQKSSNKHTKKDAKIPQFPLKCAPWACHGGIVSRFWQTCGGEEKQYVYCAAPGRPKIHQNRLWGGPKEARFIPGGVKFIPGGQLLYSRGPVTLEIVSNGPHKRFPDLPKT